MSHAKLTLLGFFVIAIPFVAHAADEQHFGATVGSVAITKYISPGSLGLKNMAQSKLASARDLVVTGNNPRFNVTGQAFCKQGAKLTAVQAMIGKVVVQNTELTPFLVYGSSAKITTVAGRKAADISLQVELKMSRRATDAAIDLSFNPARQFEQKIDVFVAKGGTAAAYLHETQAFDMNVTVNLVAWCRMDANANSVLAGKTYPGVVSRKVPITIFYNGDPAIIEGPAARATTKTQDSSGTPPAHGPTL